MFDIKISISGKRVFGEIIVDSYFFDKSKYDYAFYLYKDGSKIDSAWYSDSMIATFELKGIAGAFHIKAFIRDREYRDIRKYKSEKILVSA